MNPILCGDEIPYFLIFDFSTRPLLLFYTYIPAIIIALFLGFFVLQKDKKSLASKLLFFITLFFSLWVLDILALWVASPNDALMFGWQITPIFEVPLFLFSIYFTLVMTSKERKDISSDLKLFFIGLMAVVFAILPTHLNIVNYDISSCEGKPGLFWLFMYGGEIIAIISLIVICIKRFRSIPKTDIFRKEVFYVGISIISFLVLFAGSNIIGQVTEIQQISFIGSLGMVVFLGFLVYLIVKFKTFNIKLLATQALVLVLVTLIGSQFFFIKIPVNFVLNGFTFIASIIFGYFLVRSVKKEVRQKEELAKLNFSLQKSIKKEVRQREELAKLNIDLQKSIKARESLTHLVTHKVKGYFTRTKCVFAEMVEGSFGILPPKAKEMAAGGLASDNEGIAMVDMVLNQASLQAGLVKYDMKPFDFKKMVAEVVDDKKGPAEKKGLKMETDIKAGNYAITGDQHWLKEAILNLVDNAVKCTVTGKITVGLGLKEKQIFFYVKDTGRGITPEDRKNLYTEGGRGKDSLKYNPDSTGYGLSTVKLVVEAHKGKVWEDTEVGKGSTFYVKLPLTQK